jgi:hypothetical protein
MDRSQRAQLNLVATLLNDLGDAAVLREPNVKTTLLTLD